jgi:hypothetical protein
MAYLENKYNVPEPMSLGFLASGLLVLQRPVRAKEAIKPSLSSAIWGL